jgi:hypothetical protein
MVVQSMLTGGTGDEATFTTPSPRRNSLVGQSLTRYLLSHLKEVGCMMRANGMMPSGSFSPPLRPENCGSPDMKRLRSHHRYHPHPWDLSSCSYMDLFLSVPGNYIFVLFTTYHQASSQVVGSNLLCQLQKSR